MKVISILFGLLTFSGCTLFGLVVGASSAYEETTIEKLEPGNSLKILLNDSTKSKGRFVSYEPDTGQIAVKIGSYSSRSRDTLAIPIDSIKHIEKYHGSRPLLGVAFGLLIDVALVIYVRSTIDVM